jgi:regulator of nucleoside diphosphate kinase
MRIERNTRITDRDAARLARIVEDLLRRASAVENGAESLHDTLDAARIVPAKEIEADVVTMNSEATVEDVDSDKLHTVRLVYPEFADPGKGHVSVLSPFGNAILGAKVGDRVAFVTPVGERWVRVTGIRYQPEAAGDHDL